MTTRPPRLESSAPPIFLFGPPGVGKSTLGRRACEELHLHFVDLFEEFGPLAEGGPNLDHVVCALSRTVADVVEIPWELQHERRVQMLARQVGAPLLLWAHPEDMQLRSGRSEQLFTPVPRLTIRGGFGRNGTGCREYRQLDRACGEALLLVDLDLEEAAEDVRDRIGEIREEQCRQASPAEREGLLHRVEDWRHDHHASPRVANSIVDAMARYLIHLRAGGTSPRTLSSVCSDLNAAGHLVLMYDAPRGKRVVEHFAQPPWEFEFTRKFSDRPNLVARYRRSLEGFARFLRASGELPEDDDSSTVRQSRRRNR